MSIQTIGVGTAANDGTGDSLRAAMQKTNANLSNLKSRTINVEDYGAVGDGVTDDTSAIRLAAAALQALGGGDLVFGIFKEYKVANATIDFQSARSDGELTSAGLYEFSDCKGIRLIGNGSTILPGSTTDYGTLFLFTGCSQITVRDLRFEAGYQALDDDHGVEWLAFRQGCDGVILQNLDFSYGHTAIVFRGTFYTDGGDDTNRCRNIQIQNVSIFSTYYGCLFQGAGDNVHIRGLRGQKTGRVYFPINVKNHDVEIDGCQGGPFSDCLLKVYATTQFYSKLENIKLSYNTAGRYAGSGDETSGDTVVAMHAGLNDLAHATGATFQNIQITINAICSATDQDQGLFMIRKFNASNAADTVGRGHLLRNIRLKVNASGVSNILNQAVGICAWDDDDWTGDTIDGITIEDSVLRDCGAKVAVIAGGQALSSSKQSLYLSRVHSDGTFALLNNAGLIPVFLIDSQFSNVDAGIACLCAVNGSSITRATGLYPVKTPMSFTDDLRMLAGSLFFPNNQGVYGRQINNADVLMLSMTTGDNTLLGSLHDVLVSAPGGAVSIYTNAVQRLNVALNGVISLFGLPSYASNAAAITGGLVAGNLYRNGDNVCVVH